MNGPYRAGTKNPHATVYRQAEGDPPEGTLVAVAIPSTGCTCCGTPVTGQQIADALNAQHNTPDDALIYLVAQIAALLSDLPREERRKRLRDAYRNIDLQQARTSGGIVLTEELLDRIVHEAEQGYDISQIRPRQGRGPST